MKCSALRQLPAVCCALLPQHRLHCSTGRRNRHVVVPRHAIFRFLSIFPGTVTEHVSMEPLALSCHASFSAGDDFYQLSSGLVVVETTIGNNNAQLNQFVTPKTVLEFVRNMVANRLAQYVHAVH